jgi:hypothetical protein
MGSISFLLPNPVPAAAEALLRNACFAAGYDQAPVPTAIQIQDNRLIATWNLAESRYLAMPWPVGPHGALVTTTAVLRETDEPYRLLIELARGKLNQVRTQSAEWQAIGLRPPPGFEESLADTTRLFAKALLAPASAESDAWATRVVEQSYSLGDVLVREFVDQMFATRHHEEGLIDTRLAARMSRAPAESAAEYARTFNAAQVAFRWRDMEPEESHYDWSAPDRVVAMAREAQVPLTAGPVIDLAPGMLPEWASGWEGDLPTLAAFMCDFLETVVGRYKNDIRRWVICAGFNHADALGLDDDDRLRLAFRLFEAAAQIDPELELVVSVSQPWGEYLTNEDHTISPLTFPDDLVRAGLRVSAVELELRIGSHPRGSLPRDLLETARLINLFGLLGLPVELLLSHPSGLGPDTNAAPGETVWLPGWPAGPTPENQSEWGKTVTALGLCTPLVRAVTWDHWSDAAPHLVPSAGLHDATGAAKPLFTRLRTLRTAHLR